MATIFTSFAQYRCRPHPGKDHRWRNRTGFVVRGLLTSEGTSRKQRRYVTPYPQPSTVLTAANRYAGQ
jgi:hypothetical protein